MEFGIVGIKSLIGVKSRKSGQDMNAYILHMVRENQRDDRLEGCEHRCPLLNEKGLVR